MDLLKEHDEILFKDENGSFVLPPFYERCEQLDALAFIPANAKVLELGARIGVISCLINKLLYNPSFHVCVEPDKRVIEALNKNKERNGFEFHIFEGAISSSPLYFHPNGLSSYVSEQGRENEKIKTATLDELSKKYGLQFDVLVADCEGAFEQIMQENDLCGFRLILLEEDAPNRCDYAKINSTLTSQGFYRVSHYYNGCWRSVYANMNFLHFTISSFSSPFSLGLFGKLGFVTEENIQEEEDVISCHAPSLLELTLHTERCVWPFLFSSARKPNNLIWKIDERAMDMDMGLRLKPGKHVLTIEAEDNRWAHTGWKFM